MIDTKSNLVPLEVDDLKGMKPFRGVANKTAVAVFQKSNKKPRYPVRYTVWQPKEGEKRNIGATLSLKDVLSKVNRTCWEATPVGDEGSPWAIMPPGRFEEIRQLAKPSDWIEGRKGITVDLNGVFFVPVLAVNESDRLVQIQTQPASGKKDIGAARNFWIEPDWLYPLIKGAADFDSCYLKPNLELLALVPNTGIRSADFESVAVRLAALPQTHRYLNSFKATLESRSTWKTRMAGQGAPYYSIYNVGAFTFKPWKVIWAEMSNNFCAAVAGTKDVPLMGSRPYVPDHKVFFVAFDNEDEAHYLCGLLNSTTVSQYVEAHNVSIQVGDIFKHMRLPRYDAEDLNHQKVAAGSKAAHKIHDKDKRKVVVDAVKRAADAVLRNWVKKLKSD